MTTENIPRRIRIDKFISAETAIYDAIAAVEAAGADVRLTRAVIKLQEARDIVADLVDGVPPKDASTTPIHIALSNVVTTKDAKVPPSAITHVKVFAATSSDVGEECLMPISEFADLFWSAGFAPLEYRPRNASKVGG